MAGENYKPNLNRFLQYKFGCNYEELNEGQLLQIKDTDVAKYLNLKAFGVENPGQMIYLPVPGQTH